jgi:hypothetical protein
MEELDRVSWYTDRYDEDRRHRDTFGLLQEARTLELLDRFCPPPPARVADIGGATGVYAFPLADRGHEVSLVEYFSMVRRELSTGLRDRSPGWHFHRPEELAAEVSASGFEVDAILGVTGPGWLLKGDEGKWEDPRRERYLEIARLVERDPLIGPDILAAGLACRNG